MLSILEILLMVSSNFNSESKVITSSFSLRLHVTCTLSKETTGCVLKLNEIWLFPGLAFIL